MANGLVIATGVSSSAAAGSTTGHGSSTVVLTRVISQGFTGTLDSTGTALRIITGVSASTSLHNISVSSIYYTSDVTGIAATGAVNIVTGRGFNFKHYLYPYIYHQIPEHIRESYPVFVNFMEAYYRFLDSPDNANDILLNSGSWSNVDETLDIFVNKLRAQFSWDFPNTTIVDSRRFVKLIHEFYEAKGTELSIEMFFKLLYQDDVRVEYPSKLILRASDGKWHRDISIKLDVSNYSGNKLFVYCDDGYMERQGKDDGYVYQIGNNSNPFNLVGKIVTISFWKTIPGTGLVPIRHTTNVSEVLKTVNPVIFDLIIDLDPYTEILDGAIVEFDGLTYGTLTRQILSFEIITPGEDFRPADILYVNELGSGGEYFASDYLFNQDSSVSEVYVTDNALNNGIIRVSVVDENFGIESATIINTGYLFQSDIFEIELTGIHAISAAIVEFTTGFIYQHPGIFLDASGLLSDACRLQDNLYYQAYSYVIKTKIDPTTWKDAYLRAVHPAGTKMFSDFITTDIADLRSRTMATDDTRETLRTITNQVDMSDSSFWDVYKVLDETLVISESVAIDFSKTMTNESAIIADAGTTILFEKNTSDSTSSTVDVFDRIVDWSRSFTETPATTEAQVFIVEKTITDTATSADISAVALAKDLQDATSAINDSLLFTWNKILYDASTTLDSAPVFDLGRTMAGETTTTSDSKSIDIGLTLSDLVITTDTFGTSSAIATIDVSTTSDLMVFVVEKTFTETAITADVLDPTITWVRSFTENQTATDVASVVTTWDRAFTETQVTSETVVINTNTAPSETVVTSDAGTGYVEDYNDPDYNDPGYIGIIFNF